MAKNTALIESLEIKFEDYPVYNRQIALRKEELRLREADENIGGGRSNTISKYVENQVIKEICDPYIANRELWKKSVIETPHSLDEERRELVKAKYFGEDSWMDWASFGKKHGYSKSTIYRLRQKVLLEFGRRIGEI